MLSIKDRRLIGLSIREIAVELGGLSRKVVRGPMKPSSLSATHERSEMNVASFGDHPIVSEANFSMLLATVSGVDHVLVYCEALDRGAATTSMGSLTRGALEAFSKAFYLLNVDSTAAFIARHLALAEHELTYPLKYSRFRDFEGNEFDGSTYPAAHRLIRERLTLPKAPSPAAQGRVETLLTAGMREGAAGHNLYSQLSGVAHAATTALGMYLLSGDTGRLGYPKDIAFEHCGYLFVAVTAVAERVLSVFEPGTQESMAWRAARQRAETSMRAIDDQYTI